MGKKDGELWDDSALIDAFEDALSSYKFQMMHGMKQIDGFKDESQDGDFAREDVSDEDVKSHVERITKSDAHGSSYSLEEATSPTKDKEVNEDVSNDTLELERVEGHSNAQLVADYSSLVNQYYELQEKVQLTWQQLQLFGYSSDQFPQYTTEVGLSDSAAEVNEASFVSSDGTHAHSVTTHVNQNNDGVGGKPEPCQQLLSCGCFNCQCFSSAGVQGAYSTVQGQASTDSRSQPTAVCCFYPCTNKCMVYSSCPANVCRRCTDAVPGFCPGRSVTHDDNDIIGAAMGAAKKAISSIKIQTANQQEGSGQISINSMVINSENDGCETDFSTVVNAWFSAGLATGKYLAEQSNSKRHNG